VKLLATAAIIYAVLYVGAYGIDKAHCEHYGTQHEKTNWKLKGFCKVNGGYVVPAESVGVE
jgi:hypothetical protein